MLSHGIRYSFFAVGILPKKSKYICRKQPTEF